MTTEIRKKNKLVPYLIAISGLVISVFIFVAYEFARNSYNQAVSEGKSTATRLAKTLGEHVEVSFLGSYILLRRVIEQLQYRTYNNLSRPAVEKKFKELLEQTPQVSALALINSQGAVEIAASNDNGEDWANYSNKPIGPKLSAILRSMDNTDRYIARYDYLRSGKPTIIIARKYDRPDGSFGGLIIASINQQYFVDFYDSIAQGSHKFMAIMLYNNNSVIASSPYNSTLNELLSRQFLSDVDKSKSETYLQQATSDTYDKIMVVKLMDSMKIAVNVTIDREDYIDDWRINRLKDIGFVSLFMVFGYILAWFAITMAKQVNKVEESEGKAILASQAKSEFLATMSHELRTPLNAIIGFSEMINAGYFGDVNDKQKERINDINLCGSHLLQLINDILEFSKGEAGKLELAEEEVDLNELIDEAVRITLGRIRNKNINLVANTTPNLPMILADKRKIRQMLINLLTNSCKFTPENGTITVTSNINTNKNIWFSVTDTGVGIAEADIPKALSVFGQVNRSQNQEGTGLGLPLCKMHAELHGGKMELTSKVGEGTTVKIIFPAKRTLTKASVQQISGHKTSSPASEVSETQRIYQQPATANQSPSKQEIPTYKPSVPTNPTNLSPSLPDKPKAEAALYKPNSPPISEPSAPLAN